MSLLTNLISYWKFDEASGNAADSHGSNTLTNNGSTPYAAALINNGIDFGTSNTNKYLRNATNLGIAGNGDASFQAWLKVRTEPGLDSNFIFLGFGSTLTADRYLNCYYQDVSGTKKITIDNAGTLINYNITLGTSVWHHIVITRNVTTTTLYVDGTPQGTGAQGVGGATIDGITFGASPDASPGNFATTYMDECAVWSRLLDSGEVTGLYNGGAGLVYPLALGTSGLLNKIW